MKDLARLLAAGDTEAALVLPAGTDAEESAEIAQTFAVLGVKKIIPTRLDFARRMGGILCAADKAELAFTAGSHTPQVANGIMALGPEALANLLMPHAAKPDKRKGKA
jgi:flagellar biosynthesis protein FlhF